MGRPSTYSEQTAEAIYLRIAEGEPLRVICREEGMPPWRTVYDWIAANADFSARFARAREAGFDAIAEDCLQIADETEHDTIIVGQGDNAREAANSEWISRSKLRVETRLKLLAKWSPKKYGDKLDLNHGGSIKLAVTDLSDDDLAAIAVAGSN